MPPSTLLWDVRDIRQGLTGLGNDVNIEQSPHNMLILLDIHPSLFTVLSAILLC
jgi:hypothetical protein